MSTTWETIEERERLVRGTKSATAMVRVLDQLPAGDSLKRAFAERPFISLEDLRGIARQRYEGPVITLYLNFNPERLVPAERPGFLSVFHSLRHQEEEARKSYLESLPRAQRLQLPDDLGDIQEFLEAYKPEGARSLVVIKSGKQLNRVMPLPVRVADSLTVDNDPYVEPLEAIMEEQPRVLVIDLSKEKTSFSGYQLGYEEALQSIKSFTPTETVDAGKPGKAQRHRLTHLQWHLKASAQLADRLIRERGFDLVAVAGEETLVKEFEDYLPKTLRDRLFARLRLSPEEGPTRRRFLLDEALAQRRAREEETQLDELGFYQAHGRLAAGLETVINAANLFLMRRLFVSDQLAKAGYVCRNHHFLSLTAGPCPFDREELRPAENVVDELVEIARLHGIQVMLVMRRLDLLASYQAVAAILVTAVPLGELRVVDVTS
jgi:peptide chain release factor subunit 1